MGTLGRGWVLQKMQMGVRTTRRKNAEAKGFNYNFIFSNRRSGVSSTITSPYLSQQNSVAIVV
jgi:hypothetical protein